MRRNGFTLSIALAAILACAMPGSAATFGNVVTTVGGHPSDIALDESRGQLYIANFTACEVDVMSTATNAITTSINYSSGSSCDHAAALALSLDSRYLVVLSYQNGTSTPQGADAITVIDLANGYARRTFGSGDPPLGVAFAQCPTQVSFPCSSPATGAAIIATTTGLYLLDPATGYMPLLSTYTAALPTKLPTAGNNFPGQVVNAELSTSADSSTVWGIAAAGTGNQVIIRYTARNAGLAIDNWVTTPPLLPRVSVSSDGSWALIGWSVYTVSQCNTGANFAIRSRYPQAATSKNVTGFAMNNGPNGTDTIYGQIYDATQPTGPPYYTGKANSIPTLAVMDASNLTVRDRLYLPENLVGRGILSSDNKTMYAISDSGITVLPVGSLSGAHRLAASQEDVRVQTNFCNRNALTATFTVTDPGGNHTDFSVAAPQNGIQVTSTSATTPATVTVTVQLGAISTSGGTLSLPLTISSASAVNVPPSVRLLISTPDQDQRGTVVDVPGTLSDILPDVQRNHLYVLRQDKNEVLVFDASTFSQLAVLPTQTTPEHMSLSADGQNLVIASKDSQLLTVYNLDSLQQQTPIELPSSHYGMSVAQSNAAMLVLIENDGAPDCTNASCAVDRIDTGSYCAYHPLTLGVYANDNSVFPSTSVLAPSPDQRSILLASPGGNVMLYSADRDTFILSRQDLTSLSGAYAVSSAAASSTSGPAFQPRYIIGDNVFNSALVPQGTLDTSVGKTMGFSFTGAGGYRVTGTTAAAQGVIQTLPDVMNINPGAYYSPVPTAEAPLISTTTQPFTRTVAPMSSGIMLLTTSGFTVLAQDYNAAVAVPQISSVVNAADGTQPVAPGGLITIYGSQMSPVNAATQTVPLPTALGNSCLIVNGTPVPLLFVSSGQINAQLPFSVSGSATLSIHTTGGISNNFNFPVQTAAPSVFLSGTAGPETGLATIVRADNNQLVTPTNPIHPKDTIVIYLTGMGATVPQMAAGMPGPSNPLASVAIPPTVTLGGTPLNVLYAGLVPGEVGVYQINATVPSGVAQGLDIPLVINQSGSATTLSVRVVN